MNCITCGAEIQSAFKHSIAKNECPFCGGSIMGEEMMALIEDVERTILSEATVREETAKKLAMTIVTRYDLSMKDFSERIPQAMLQKQVVQVRTPLQPENEKIKVAPPSAYQQISKTEIKENPATLNISEILASNQNLSASEKEKLMEEAVKEKYNMIDQTALDPSFITEDEDDIPIQQHVVSNTKLSAALSEAATNPVLEQERLARLAKQKQALRSGSGAFRRSG